jgi:AcrR family transcriptional regulator
MPQVLKEEIRERIFYAAEEVFYEKDFRSAKMQDIANRAGIPVGLIYSYYKNKEDLFNDVVEPVYFAFHQAIKEEESSLHGFTSKSSQDAGVIYMNNLFANHKKLVILVDKGSGTKHAHAKDELVHILELHIRKALDSKTIRHYDNMLIHILASNFTESLLEIARHYKNDQWAQEMFTLVNQCYFKGVDSL